MVSQSIVNFSESNLQVDDIAQYYQDTTSSIQLYFSLDNPDAASLFAGKSKKELQDKLNDVFEENELLISMNLLSALEAAFRIDYLQRCYKKKKDSLSRALQQIHQKKGNKASLEDDIFDAWKQHTNVPNHLVSELKGAFKYRHWLAHGRYWEPKLGRKYDYFSVYTLGQTVVSSFSLEGH